MVDPSINVIRPEIRSFDGLVDQNDGCPYQKFHPTNN